jgi:hypothetical protein
MANPYSGLENIGQSYLQGVQLANQRQAREEAIAQRQEEARVRERYYQDLVDQRREAAALNAKLREEGLATRFGRFLKRTPEGEIDIVKSAEAQTEAGDKDQLLETFGFAEAQGIQVPDVELTPEDRKSKSYLRGKTKGIVQTMVDEQNMTRILASQGVLPGRKALPATLDAAISGAPRDTEFNVLREIAAGGTTPESLAKTPDRTTDSSGVPEGYNAVMINGREVLVKKPAVKAARPVFVKTVKVKDSEGNETEMKYTKEDVEAGLDRLVAPPATGATNAAPTLPVFGFDVNGGGWLPSR